MNFEFLIKATANVVNKEAYTSQEFLQMRDYISRRTPELAQGRWFADYMDALAFLSENKIKNKDMKLMSVMSAFQKTKQENIPRIIEKFRHKGIEPELNNYQKLYQDYVVGTNPNSDLRSLSSGRDPR